MTSTQFTILQLNDSHGYLDLHPEMFWQGGMEVYGRAGGFARIATLLEETRAERFGRVLAFDCGDTIHGTYPVVQSRGEILLPILNELGLDAMTAHWDFAYGPDYLQRFAERLNYPLLAINCFDEETDELVFHPYIVKELGGVRVGVIGLAATIVDKVMPASFSEGVYLTLGNEELPGWIGKLRGEEGVDLVVVISHLGFPQEMKLASEVDGIDVLLSAHTHNRLYRPALVNDTIVIQSGCHGSFLGRLDLEVEGGRIVDYHHRLRVVGEEVEPHRGVQALVEEALASVDRELVEEVGRTEMPLHRYRVLESTMDTFLLQSMLEVTGAQLAFSNGWRYGAPIPPGPITLNDLWNIIPVNPPISTCTLTGDELRAMLEENLERTFARDPYEQMGGYVKRSLGLHAYVKVENPAGQRIEHLFVDGARVRPDDLFATSFVTTQGVPAKYGSDREALDVRAVEGLQRYLEEHERTDAELRGTFVAI